MYKTKVNDFDELKQQLIGVTLYKSAFTLICLLYLVFKWIFLTNCSYRSQRPGERSAEQRSVVERASAERRAVSLQRVSRSSTSDWHTSSDTFPAGVWSNLQQERTCTTQEHIPGLFLVRFWCYKSPPVNLWHRYLRKQPGNDVPFPSEVKFVENKWKCGN